MRINEVFAERLDLTPGEKTVLDTWIGQIESNERAVAAITSSGGGGGVTSLDAGSVEINWSEGISLKNPDTGKITVRLDPDGDAWFGKDTTDPDTLTMFIMSNDQTWNSEDFGEGDLLIGSNSAGEGNIFWDDSLRKLYFRSGTTVSVTIGDGGIEAEWGKIGGWNITDTTLEDDVPYIVIDSANARITVGVANEIIIDGQNERIQVGKDTDKIQIDGDATSVSSTTYSEGLAGFHIDPNYAEFGDIRVRGSIKAATFEYGEIQSVGGDVYISKDAGTVATPGFTTPAVSATVQVGVRTHQDGSQWGAAGDKVHIATWDGSSYVSVWMTLTTYLGTGLDTKTGETYAIYTATMESGDVGVDITPGTSITNLGPSGYGFIDLKGGATTRFLLGTHAGSPWSAATAQVVIGYLYPYYDADEDVYGFGVGDFSSGNYLVYNADGAGSFDLVAGTGAISISPSGMKITDSGDTKSQIRWVYDDSGTDRKLAEFYGDYDNGTSLAVAWHVAWRQTGAPWSNVAAIVLATDSIASKSSGASFYGDGHSTITGDSTLYVDYKGTITLKASSGANSSNIYIAPADTITLESDNVVHISNKGLYIGSSGASTVSDGYLVTTGGVLFGGGLQVHGSALGTSSGVGLEFGWLGTYSRILSYSRTAGTRQPLTIDASTIAFALGGTNVVHIGSGDIYSDAWKSYSPTWTGFSSISTNACFYKRIGKTLNISFRVIGTSNATTKTMSLPYTAAGSMYQWGWTHAQNAGTWGNGSPCQVNPGASVITFYWYIPSGAWTASGTCEIRGQMVIELA